MVTKEEIQNSQIMALSWKQPFGTLMQFGKIETRTWPTNYRGLVLICSSKEAYDKDQLLSITGLRQFFRFAKVCQDHHVISAPVGMALSIGRLTDCRKMTIEDEDKCFVKYYPDLYCHIYEDVTRIEPFPWKGTQGFRYVKPKEKDRIKIFDPNKLPIPLKHLFQFRTSKN